MRFLRNREIKAFIILLVAIASTAIAACFFFPHAAVAIASTALLVFIGLFLFFTYRRYAQIDRLSAYLRKINRGDYTLDVSDNTEGELSILKSEIFKVTVMLREQNEALCRDKTRLSNALSDISHQLKTPLTSMFMMTDLLYDEDLPDEKRREFTGRIRAQLERLEWLVSALLKLSRLDAKTVRFRRNAVPLVRLIEKAAAPLLIPMELKNQTLTVAGDVVVRCDENWTGEALLNILKNCVEHTPGSGKITVECADNPLYTEIRISDSGPGIDPKDLPHVFNRFYRGKNASNDSVGIGLAMSAAIIEEQGGTIEAKASSKGSVFIVRFSK
jgi:signal transduction histidine kinase